MHNFRTLALHEHISSAVAAVKKVEKATIHSVNGMFVEKLIPLRSIFLENLKKYYNSDVVHVDFENGGYAATNYINKYPYICHSLEQIFAFIIFHVSAYLP